MWKSNFRRPAPSTRRRLTHWLIPRRFDIAYDDGEHETRVKEEFIKALDSDSEDDRRSSSKKPREGDKCEAEFKNTGKYYPGTVKREHSDGTYEILFV